MCRIQPYLLAPGRYGWFAGETSAIRPHKTLYWWHRFVRNLVNERWLVDVEIIFFQVFFKKSKTKDKKSQGQPKTQQIRIHWKVLRIPNKGFLKITTELYSSIFLPSMSSGLGFRRRCLKWAGFIYWWFKCTGTVVFSFQKPTHACHVKCLSISYSSTTCA